MNFLPLPYSEYRNPFHFLDEFDQWFEFEKRRRFDKESTCVIICDMLKHDLIRARKSMDRSSGWEITFNVTHDFGLKVLSTKGLRYGGSA